MLFSSGNTSRPQDENLILHKNDDSNIINKTTHGVLIEGNGQRYRIDSISHCEASHEIGAMVKISGTMQPASHSF